MPYDCAHVNPLSQKKIKIPTKALGKILDHGKSSIYAVHLLAIKCAHGDGFVLNDKYCRKKYGISDKCFRAGVDLLKRSYVIRREQPNRTGYAKEEFLVIEGGFILVPECVITQKSKIAAMAIIANLAPSPIRPGIAAKRIGITSKKAVLTLTKNVIESGYVDSAQGKRGEITIGRLSQENDWSKKHRSEKHRSEKHRTHSNKKEVTDTCKRAQKKERMISYWSNEFDRGSQNENDQQNGIEWMDLADWKTCSHWRGEYDEDYSRSSPSRYMAEWIEHLKQRCPNVPGHLLQPYACTQAIEVAEYIHQAFDGAPSVEMLLPAIANAIAKAVAQGKVIRSLGFIAQDLATRAEYGDYSWARSYPSTVDEQEYTEAFNLAAHIVDTVTEWGIDVEGGALLATYNIERLAGCISGHNRGDVIKSVNNMIENDAMSDLSNWRDVEQNLIRRQIKQCQPCSV